jgi:aminoglycoside 6'-N-acetyltransferase I
MLDLVTQTMKKSDLDNCSKIFSEEFSKDPWNEEWTPDEAYKVLLNILNTPGFIGLTTRANKELVGFIMGNVEPWLKGSFFTFENSQLRIIFKNKVLERS